MLKDLAFRACDLSPVSGRGKRVADTMNQSAACVQHTGHHGAFDRTRKTKSAALPVSPACLLRGTVLLLLLTSLFNLLPCLVQLLHAGFVNQVVFVLPVKAHRRIGQNTSTRQNAHGRYHKVPYAAVRSLRQVSKDVFKRRNIRRVKPVEIFHRLVISRPELLFDCIIDILRM